MKRAKPHARRNVVPKPRNPVARSPLLGKGGVHEKSAGAKRRQAQMSVQKLTREALDPDKEGR
jgi:hypothetical protein